MRWLKLFTPISRPFWVPNLRYYPELGWSDAWIQIIRVIAIAVLTTGIVWGSTNFQIFLKDIQITWFDVDADLQLALLGFFNKMLDVLLISSLEYTASMLLTTWMTVEDKAKRGATFGDFDLKNELTKPWMALNSFAWRCRNLKWNWKSRNSWTSLFRFLLCLCISICVLLQGLAINTIAIPKQRWYPNRPDAHNGWSVTNKVREEMIVAYPKMYLQELAWSKHLALAKANLGDEGASEAAFVLAASRSFDALADITSTYSKYWKGWQPVLNRNVSGSRSWTGLNTTFDARYPVETLSVTDKQVWDVFHWLRNSHHHLTVESTGWTGNLTLMVPALNTVCQVHGADTVIPERSITVHPSRDQLANTPSFTVDLGPIATRGFPGAKCTVDFKQALHSFSMWIIDMQPPDVSQNQYWSKFNESLLYQDTLVQDYTITYALAEQTASALTYMNHLMGQNGMLDHLLRMSRKLQQDIETIVSDAHGLSVIMAVLVQNMISFSDDISPKLPPELPTDPNHIITSYPIQWQIYGSGPRLAWQWAAVFVLIVILGCFLFGLWQTGKYWIAPGSWTEIPGMMIVAQATVPKLRDIEDEKKASKFLYCIGKEPELMLYINN